MKTCWSIWSCGQKSFLINVLCINTQKMLRETFIQKCFDILSVAL